MDYPLVSILVSTYNDERFLSGALDSALAQTYPNFEVVVIDDASTDRTGEMVRAYGDACIRYIRQEKNIGILLTRNHLLREARGDFFTFLDSDDRYLPDKVKAEVAFLMAHTEHAAVYCDLRCVLDDSGILYEHTYPHFEGAIFEPLLDRIFIANSSFMMRRSVYDALGGYDEATGVVEDWEYFLRMAYAGMLFGFLDKDLVRLSIRADSLSRHKTKNQESSVAIMKKFNAMMSPGERVRYRMPERIATQQLRLAIAYLAAGRKKEFYGAWHAVRQGIAWRLLSWPIFAGVWLVPARAIQWAIWRVATFKKKRLFIPAALP